MVRVPALVVMLVSCGLLLVQDSSAAATEGDLAAAGSACPEDQYMHRGTQGEEDSCQPKIKIGEICVVQEYDTVCEDTAACVDAHCKQVGSDSQCRKNDDCEMYHSCTFSPDDTDDQIVNGECVSLPGIGDYCNSDDSVPCRFGGVCEMSDHQTSEICRSDGTTSVHCDNDDELASDNCSADVAYCSSSYNTCESKVALNETCTRNWECLSDACRQGYCVKENTQKPCRTEEECCGKDGDACPSDWTCLRSNGEDEGVCGREPGAKCSSTSDCGIQTNDFCYDGHCETNVYIKDKPCATNTECGGSKRRLGTSGQFYIKLGFTCDGGQCRWFSKKE
jgi:hypothetical protein